MRSIRPSSGSADGRGVPGAARAASSASASRSTRDSSLMDVPHLGPQAFKRAELQLLDRALGALESFGDLADALLLDEALRSTRSWSFGRRLSSPASPARPSPPPRAPSPPPSPLGAPRP